MILILASVMKEALLTTGASRKLLLPCCSGQLLLSPVLCHSVFWERHPDFLGGPPLNPELCGSWADALAHTCAWRSGQSADTHPAPTRAVSQCGRQAQKESI